MRTHEHLYYVLDENRNVVGLPLDDDVSSVVKWAKMFKEKDRIVKQEDVGPYFVSTVFLGLDHNWGDGPPHLFETMVFKGSESDLDCRRCSTWKEAEKQHEAMVRKWSKK